MNYNNNERYAIVHKEDNISNITNRNEKFLIRVFTGRDISIKQNVKSTTISPIRTGKLIQAYVF